MERNDTRRILCLEKGRVPSRRRRVVQEFLRRLFVTGREPAAAEKIPGVTGVILAGGEGRRMGCDKALLPIDGALFIDHVYARLAALFDEVLIVTNAPEFYRELPCRKVPDLYPCKGVLAGIHAGLCHAGREKIFVAACDMPFLSAAVIRRLCRERDQGDVVIPRSDKGVEPLHALYDKRCRPAIKATLEAGEKRIVSFFPQVRVHEVPAEVFQECDPAGRSFCNINTPQEYFALREQEREEADAADAPGEDGDRQRAGLTDTPQNLNSGILASGSRASLVSRLAAASR